jgi:hypothetical protein
MGQMCGSRYRIAVSGSSHLKSGLLYFVWSSVDYLATDIALRQRSINRHARLAAIQIVPQWEAV